MLRLWRWCHDWSMFSSVLLGLDLGILILRIEKFLIGLELMLMIKSKRWSHDTGGIAEFLYVFHMTVVM